MPPALPLILLLPRDAAALLPASVRALRSADYAFCYTPAVQPRRPLRLLRRFSHYAQASHYYTSAAMFMFTPPPPFRCSPYERHDYSAAAVLIFLRMPVQRHHTHHAVAYDYAAHAAATIERSLIFAAATLPQR